jgi:hypothetical protein
MLSKDARKEAIRQFKEQKPEAGMYAVRCTETGHVWVGKSRNLDAAKNGCWFSLRNGMHREASLQKEWNEFGESAFEYEILEKLDADLHPMQVEDLLKAGKSKWLSQLKAQPLL